MSVEIDKIRKTGFKPSDTSHLVPKQDVVNSIIAILQNLQKEKKENVSEEFEKVYKELKIKIESLKQICLHETEIINSAGKTEKSSSYALNEVYQAYEDLKTISLYFRFLLKNDPTATIDKYLTENSIRYTILTDNGIVFEDAIKVEWFTLQNASNENAALAYKTKEMAANLAETLAADSKRQAIDQIVRNHEDVLHEALKKTAQGETTVNAGKVFEAFIEHMEESHSDIMGFLTNKKAESDEYNLDTVLAEFQPQDPNHRWSDRGGYAHESLTQGWQHYRSASGQMVATASGDVGRWQAKADNTVLIDVKTLQTLIDSLKKGIQMFNNTTSEQEITEVANVIAEKLTEGATPAVNEIIDDAIQQITEDLAKDGVMKPIRSDLLKKLQMKFSYGTKNLNADLKRAIMKDLTSKGKKSFHVANTYVNASW